VRLELGPYPAVIYERKDSDVAMRPSTKKRRIVDSDEDEDLKPVKPRTPAKVANNTPEKRIPKKAKPKSSKKSAKIAKSVSSRASSVPPSETEKSVAEESKVIDEDEDLEEEEELSDARSEEAAVASKT
jgi:hypothetical protein